jgi:single-stranded DNA-binding protein
MLRVILVGNLGSDAEMRNAVNERPVANFGVAVNQVRTTLTGAALRAAGRTVSVDQALDEALANA